MQDRQRWRPRASTRTTRSSLGSGCPEEQRAVDFIFSGLAAASAAALSAARLHITHLSDDERQNRMNRGRKTAVTNKLPFKPDTGTRFTVRFSNVLEFTLYALIR